MKDRDVFNEQGNKVIDIFCDFIKEKGLSVLTFYDHDLGFGFIASKNDRCC